MDEKYKEMVLQLVCNQPKRIWKLYVSENSLFNCILTFFLDI